MYLLHDTGEVHNKLADPLVQSRQQCPAVLKGSAYKMFPTRGSNGKRRRPKNITSGERPENKTLGKVLQKLIFWGWLLQMHKVLSERRLVPLRYSRALKLAIILPNNLLEQAPLSSDFCEQRKMRVHSLMLESADSPYWGLAPNTRQLITFKSRSQEVFLTFVSLSFWFSLSSLSVMLSHNLTWHTWQLLEASMNRFNSAAQQKNPD